MPNITQARYGNILLTDVHCGELEDWDDMAGDIIRVQLPSCLEYVRRMRQRNYRFLDRTLGADLNPAKASIPFKADRFHIEMARAPEADLFAICLEAFQEDSRFAIAGPDLYRSILSACVDKIRESLICCHHGEIVGFLALDKTTPGKLFIKLAAVKKKYQASGAGMALYARATELAREEGFRALSGRISSKNMPALNLYATLGSRFSLPLDIFIRNNLHVA